MRAAALLLLSCVLLAGVAGAQPAGSGAGTGEPSRIYGVEVETSRMRDRVLVFADGFLRPRLEEVDAGTVMLSFPQARLDPSTPAQVAPKEEGGVVHSVTVFEDADEPDLVRLTVLRSAGISPSLSQRGGQVALDFRRPGRARTPTPRAQPEPTLEARWINLGLADVVERLARFLERRVIIDEGTVRGRISLEAPDPITRDEAAAIFDAVLLLQGLAAVRGPADTYKVVPLAAKPGRWVETLEGQPEGEALVTLLRLEEVDAELAAQAIEPLVDRNGLVQVFAPTNAVLMAGVQSRLARLARVLKQLDEEGATRTVLIPLRHADAEQTEAAVAEAFEDEHSLRVWSDARAQRLIVRARLGTLERVRDFVDRIDRPSEGRGNIQVISLQYADAERAATWLRDLSTQGEAQGEEGAPLVRGARSLAGRDFAVSVHPPTRSLVVQADPSTISVIRELLTELDRVPQRVMVEVGVAEVSLSTNLDLSFDSIVPLVEPDDAEDLVAFVITSPSGSAQATSTDDAFFGRIARSPILVPIVDPVTGQSIVLPIPRETAVVTADASEVRSRMLMRPQLLLLSGEEHEIFVGDNVPVPTASTGEVTNPLRTSQTVERRDTGVSVRVRPTIPEEGPIALELDLELSAVSGAITGGPTFIERTLEVVVRLESGRSAVIGSAALPGRSSRVVGIPFLMDIPFLGWLFRSTQDLERKTHLLITVSAYRQRPDAHLLTGWMLERLEEDESDVASTSVPDDPRSR